MAVIVDVEQLTPVWLSEVLRRAGVLMDGQVESVTVGPASERGSVIHLLELRYTPGSVGGPQQLVLKLPHRTRRKSVERELDFYIRLAPQLPAGLAIRCYDAAFDPESGRFHLLMESLAATHQSQPMSVLPPDDRSSEQIVDALALLHRSWWGYADPGADARAAALAALEREQRRVEEVYPAFADFLGDRLSTKRRTLLALLLRELFPLWRRRLAEGTGLTIAHHDPHIGNFLYPRSPEHGGARIIDWKSWGVNLGALDMASMMALWWFPERRARLETVLLRRYQQQLEATEELDYPWARCWDDYRLSVMRLIFFPIRQHADGRPDYLWWPHFERLMLAYDDLGCAALLGAP